VKDLSGTGAALVLLLASLSGCSGLFHSNARPEQVYYLRAPSGGGAGVSRADGTRADGTSAAGASNPAALVPPASLRVSHPLTSPGLDTPRIMLVQNDHRLNFYAGSRWPSAAPDVIESLLAQTLRASGAWASVEDTASPFPSDYLLQTVVRRFEADYTGGAATPVVYVVIDCLIGRGEGREVIATFSATGSAPAPANRLSEVVGAFEQASGAALNSLASQAAQAVRDDQQRRAHGDRNDRNPASSSGAPGR
jgi:cholesterol transport system auxiliary component